MSIFASEGRRDGLSILKSALGMVIGDTAGGGVEGARVKDMARSGGIVVAVFSFHMGFFAFVLHTGCPVLSSISCRHKKSFQLL